VEERESCAGKGRARLSEAAKKCFLAGRLISAAEAGVEDLPVIAAVNRCATQNQAHRGVFPQPVSVVP